MFNDYKFWMVVHPAKFLPLFIVLLVFVSLFIHVAVVANGKYNHLAALTTEAPAK